MVVGDVLIGDVWCLDYFVCFVGGQKLLFDFVMGEGIVVWIDLVVLVGEQCVVFVLFDFVWFVDYIVVKNLQFEVVGYFVSDCIVCGVYLFVVLIVEIQVGYSKFVVIINCK